MAIIFPLTTQIKKGVPYQFHFKFQEDAKSAVILSQVRIIDSKRIVKKIGTMIKEDFQNMKKALKQFLTL